MAIAVSVGTVIIAAAAAVELRVSDGLNPFDAKLFIGLSVAVAGIAAMAAIGIWIAPYGPAYRAVMLLLLFPFILWGTLRLGLTRSERGAFGRAGRWARLTR